MTTRCLCGGVKVEITGKVGPLVYCHCTNCRKSSGSALTANVTVRSRYWSWLEGENLIREFESSPGVLRAFCSRCGSPVYSRREGDSESFRFRLGGFDSDPGRRSSAHFFRVDGACWFEVSDGLPEFERGPADHADEIEALTRSR